MSDTGFKAVQQNMAAHLRDPDKVAGPVGIEPRRLKIYQDLIFNNIEGFISGAFPVLRSLYDEDTWLKLVREFVLKHQSHSPYFLHISQEFLQFLQNEYQLQDGDPPFMLELAHYEWTELALDVAEEEEPDGQPLADLDDESLLSCRAKLSPLAWPLSYHYPVHQISEEYQPEAAPEQPSFFVVYRHQEEICFLQSNAVTIRLLLLINERSEESLSQVLTVLAEEMQHPDPSQLIAFALPLLRDLASKSILYLA